MYYTHARSASALISMLKLNKAWYLLLLATLSAGVLFTEPGSKFLTPAQAATFTVCASGCTHTTIQAAVNAAAAAAGADTINVSAGTYAESVTIPAGAGPLTINGANANINPCTGTRSAESIVDPVTGPAFNVLANNVTINGFRIQDAVNDAGITLVGGTSGNQVLNNIVTTNTIGIYLNGSSQLVQNNSIFNNNLPGSGSGNGIYSDQGLINSTVNANCFPGTPATFHANASIIILGSSSGGACFPGSQPISNVALTNNTLTNDNLFYLIGGSNYTITGNTNTGSATHAVQIDGGVSGATISNNNFSNGAFSAIRVSNNSGCSTNSGIVATCNRLVNFGDDAIRLTAGTYTGGANSLNAENNWFGCNAGPGATGCETITDPSGQVDFTPWLTLTLAANPPLVAQGSTTTLTASLNTNSASAATSCGINGAPTAFASTCGTVNPASTTTTGGNATSTLTVTAPAGTCSAQTTIDGQTVTQSVSVAQVSTPTITIVDPFGCTGPGDVLNVTVTVTNPAAIAQTITLNATLPAGLVGLPGTGTSTVGAAPTVNAASVSFGPISFTAGQSATLTYQVQVGDAAAAASLCITTATTFGGVAGPTVQTCTIVNCQSVGPGLVFPSTADVSDQKAGSVLVYNLYSSSISSPNSQNTRISLTNTNPDVGIAVHLFFVDGATCSIADSMVCLTPNQTASFLASDIDPGTTGYIVAVASSLVTGCPVGFNFLIGDEYVKLSSGHAANLAAEAFAALAGGLPACNAASVTAQLNFDGVSYNRAPRVLAASNIPSRADGNDTLIVLNRFGGSLAAGAATLGSLFGILYDDAENPLSFTFTAGVCQFRSSLSNNFPRVAPRFENFIPAGRSGWAKFYSQSDIGLFGAQLNFNGNAGTAANAFNQGHNLHKLTLTSAATLTIPIFPPNC